MNALKDLIRLIIIGNEVSWNANVSQQLSIKAASQGYNQVFWKCLSETASAKYMLLQIVIQNITIFRGLLQKGVPFIKYVLFIVFSMWVELLTFPRGPLALYV